MANTPTTPASVASRLTDEEILKLAKDCDGLVSTDYATGEPDYFGDLEVKKAAVLRDYVRVRRENCELRKCLKETKEISAMIAKPKTAKLARAI